MDLRNSSIYYQKKHYYIKMYVLNHKMEHKYINDTFFTGTLQEIEEIQLRKMINESSIDFDLIYEVSFEIYEITNVSTIKKKAVAFKEIKTKVGSKYEKIKTNKQVNKLITTFKYKI